MTEKISESKTIPSLLEAVKKTYGVEVPTIGNHHPLFNLWEKSITVIEGTAPAPRFSATAAINNEFPFNFAESFPEPKLGVNLKIDIFETAPQVQEARGIKTTVFLVPRSNEHPNGVIVKRGLTFVDKLGNPVGDNLSSTKIPDESVVPPEAKA